MAQNPLQHFFRQPKVYISLPSHGIYNQQGTINGPVENMPVFGMTGMDEIMLKTPDALITGDSTVKVIQSCCPSIINAWDVSNLDVDALLVAIRIATFGNAMSVNHICNGCAVENSYDIDVSKYLEHFARCEFDPTVVVDNLTIRIRPLNYKQVTEFNLENFGLQKRLAQAVELEAGDEKTKILNDIYKDLGLLQNKVFIAGIEQVATPDATVTEHAFIKEWIENCDREIFAAIKVQVTANNAKWRIPAHDVTCESCGHQESFTVDMDQTSFFASA